MPTLQLVAIAGVLLVTTLASRTAEAAFQPPVCSPFTTVPVKVGSTLFDRDPYYLIAAPARGLGSSNHYLDYTNIWIPLYLDSNVTLVIPYNSTAFTLENTYDHLFASWTGNGNHGGTDDISGTYAAGGLGDHVYQIDNTGLVQFQFSTDYSNTYPYATYIDSLTLDCSQHALSSHEMEQNQRNDGVLIDSGDVIYFWMEQTAELKIAMSPLVTTSGADFDLYVSSVTGFPDDTSYLNGDPGVTDWRGYTSNAAEALLIPYPGTPRYLYVGVHSYHGGGHFTLRAYQYHGTGSPFFDVCTPGRSLSPSDPGASGLAQTLRDVSLRALAGSEGTILPLQYAIHPEQLCLKADGAIDYDCAHCDSNCDICVAPPVAQPGCYFSTAVGLDVRMPELECGNYNDPYGFSQAMVHEIVGHYFLGQSDERGSAPAWFVCPPGENCDYWTYCGHSMMGDQWQSHVFCTDDEWSDPSLNPNHCFDPSDPGVGYPHGYATDCAVSKANWYTMDHYPWDLIRKSGVSPDPTPAVVNNPSMQALVDVQFLNY